MIALSWLHPAATAHAAIGTAVENVEMPTADGGMALALRDVEANVLVFFRPHQERSVEALRELARCQAGFNGKSVHWAAVISGSAAADAAAAMLRESRFAAPLLVDRGDRLYGSLELALHPVVVVVGRDRKLAAFEPFRSVDFCSVVSARIRVVLHDMSDEELTGALAPARSGQGGTEQVARRHRALAEALFQAKNYGKALESARKSLEKDPSAAPVHALLGRILAAQGQCDEATASFQRALAIDAANVAANGGLDQCKGR